MTDIALRVQITGADRGGEATIRKVATAIDDLTTKSRQSGAAARDAVAPFSDLDVLPSIEEITAEIEKLIGVERAVEQVTRASISQYEAAEKALQRMGLSAQQVEDGLRKMGLAQERVAASGAGTQGEAAALNAQVAALDQATQARVRSIAATIQSANASTSEADALRQALAIQQNVAGVVQSSIQAEREKAAAQAESAASVSDVEVAQARLNRLRGLSTAQLQAEVESVRQLPPAIRDEELAILELAGAMQRLEAEQARVLAADREQVAQQIEAARTAEAASQATERSAAAQERSARAAERSGQAQERAGARTRRGASGARTALQQLVITGTGLPGVLGRAAGALASFSVGGVVAVAVVAGLGAIAAAWRGLTKDIREQKEEAESAATSLVSTGLARSGSNLVLQLLGQREALREAEATLNRLQTAPSLVDRARAALSPEGVTGGGLQKLIADASAEVVKFRVGVNEAENALRSFGETGQAAIGDAFLSRLQADVDRASAGAAALERAASVSFEQGKISVEAFFAARRQALEESSAAEIRRVDALAAELARRAGVEAGIDPRSPASTQAGAAADSARAAASALREQRQQRINALLDEQFQTEEALVGQVNEVNRGLLVAQGRLEAASRNELETSLEGARRTLAQFGLDAAEIERRIDAARTAGIAQGRLDTIQRGVAAAFEETERLASEVQARVDAGLITERQGRREILALERQRLPVLAQFRDQLVAVQSTLTDPAAIAAVAALVTQLDNATTAATGTGRAALDLQLAFAQVAESQLATFLSETVFEAKNAGDAFRSFASGVVDDINRIVSRIIAAQITSAVLGIATGGLGFNLGGEVPQRRATGGVVHGPRHPVDRVPVWLTGGEYVFDTRSVGRAGLPFMRALHASLSGGLTPPAAIRRNRMPGHFAEGGLVTAGAPGRGGGSDRLRAEFDVSPDLVLRNLESTSGVRALVRIMASNPKTFNSALRG